MQKQLNQKIMPLTLLNKFTNILSKQKCIDETLNLLELLSNEYGFRFFKNGNNNYLTSYNIKPLINFYIDDDLIVKYSLLDNILI